MSVIYQGLDEDELVNEIVGQCPSSMVAGASEFVLRAAIRRGLNRVLRGEYDADRSGYARSREA